LVIAAGAISRAHAGNPFSAYANAYLVLTSSNDSELATASANSSVGFADADSQPGLAGNSILVTLPAGSLASFEIESVSGFSDVLTINDPSLTGKSGTVQFNFLVSGTEIATASTPGYSSITATADFTSPGLTDDLSFTKDSNGTITGTDFLGVQETATVPFVFGTPFTVALQIDISGLVEGLSGGGSATTSGTFSTTSSTSDVVALVAGNPAQVTGFNEQSASGATYLSPDFVPEPDGVILAMAGLAVLPLLRIRRRFRV
jgi:hypothetical protein